MEHSELYTDGQLQLGPVRLTIAEEASGAWGYLVAESRGDDRIGIFSGLADGGEEAAATTALALYHETTARCCSRPCGHG